MSEIEKWFLQFSSKRYRWVGSLAHGDGRPWADGSTIASREGVGNPWDEGCRATTFIGGHSAMSAMRDAFEMAIDYARVMPPDVPPSKRGHVYLAFWRFNPLRDLSDANSWGLGPWVVTETPVVDQSALGLLLRMMTVGIEVRMLLWQPEATTDFVVGHSHMEDHIYTARAVQAWDHKLRAEQFPLAKRPIGVVGLDQRVAERPRPAAQQQPQIHNKLVVIRVGEIAEAHCGGMDLSFTRRDAPMMSGDWQSGADIPSSKDRWPGWHTYRPLKDLDPPMATPLSDLPKEVYGERRQCWHDQSVKLEGPVVAVLEDRFRQHWSDHGIAAALENGDLRPQVGQVVFSSRDALAGGSIVPLDPAKPIAPTGRSAVQVWSTVPQCARRLVAPFTRGEYTVMAGIANACCQSKELIWIFDQYFWNRPLARLLNRMLNNREGLRAIIVLPPYAGGGEVGTSTAGITHDIHHYARRLALSDLTGGMDQAIMNKVAIYSLWRPSATSTGRGVYCHAKAQTYDGSLFVCGSANWNRRSFTRDIETVTAIADPEVVHQHQQQLWHWLFKNASWPAGNNGKELRLDRPGTGAKFFEAFKTQALCRPSYLIEDRWYQDSCVLPNGVIRHNNGHGLPDINGLLDLTDPNALPVPEVETAPTFNQIARLDQIVDRLESEYWVMPGNRITWPWRDGKLHNHLVPRIKPLAETT
ncbi:MAG TPA: phospholipase D-like domain-containing protein [Blastocatellia bacterium]|nr:phospholipase D-like domain-containing protein [Blastocatellia bacterium]